MLVRHGAHYHQGLAATANALSSAARAGQRRESGAPADLWRLLRARGGSSLGRMPPRSGRRLSPAWPSRSQRRRSSG
jgi:hypothetical protein